MGAKFHHFLAELVNRAGGKLEAAQRGILHLDEVNSIQAHETSLDVGGVGVQRQLLTPLEGDTVLLGRDANTSFRTHHVTFVATGSFGNKILSDNPDYIHAHAFEPWFEPQFIARFHSRVQLLSLDEDALLRILLHSASSPIKQLQNLAALEGVELVFEPKAVRLIANLAAESELGGRGLIEVVTTRLAHVSDEIRRCREEGVRKLIVEPVTVLKGVAPVKEKGDLRPSRADIERLMSLQVKPGSTQNQKPPSLTVPSPRRSAISPTTGWTREQIEQRLQEVKTRIRYAAAPSDVRAFWDKFEKKHAEHPESVLLVAEVVLEQCATLEQFVTAWRESKLSDLDRVIDYFSFWLYRDRFEKPLPVAEKVGVADELIRKRLEEVKVQIGYAEAPKAAREFWDISERRYSGKLAEFLQIAESILARKATLVEFHQAHVESKITDGRWTFRYLDYLLYRERVEMPKREQAAKKPAAERSWKPGDRFKSGEACPVAGIYLVDGFVNPDDERVHKVDSDSIKKRFEKGARLPGLRIGYGGGGDPGRPCYWVLFEPAKGDDGEHKPGY